ncbi:MAG: indole-3-glycerol-phosphate synthase [bacterium]|nr:indole-3-glycerol-phosphate synthase [bacterium]
MGNILDEIVENRERLILEEMRRCSPEERQEQVEKKLASGYRPEPFTGHHKEGEPFLIAEIKKASPSKGVIREDFDVGFIAGVYHRSPYVKAISVLSEPDYFSGSYENIEITRNRGEKKPILMKDFIVDEYQVYRGFLAGASAVLLISSILDEKRVEKLRKTAESLGMSILFEAHTIEEYRRGIDLGMNIIGINNRDLKTFKTDIATSINILEKAGKPEGTLVISESGIHAEKDAAVLRQGGIDGFLVGEHFMRDESIEGSIEALMGGGK